MFFNDKWDTVDSWLHNSVKHVHNAVLCQVVAFLNSHAVRRDHFLERPSRINVDPNRLVVVFGGN